MLWLVVLVKCLTPPVWSSPTGVFSWAAATKQEAIKHERTERAETTAITLRISKSQTDPIQRRERPADSADSHRLDESNNLRESADNDFAATAPVAKSVGIPTRDSTVPHPNSGEFNYAQFGLLAIWVLGAAVYLAGAVWTLLRWRRIVRGGASCDEGVAAQAVELARRLDIRRRVQIRVTDEPAGPFAFGLFRPIIVLPKSLVWKDGSRAQSNGMNSVLRSLDEIEPLLAHELVHIRRGNALVGLFQVAAQCMWWFHPLVWWANRQLTRERERCCDEEVVAGLSLPPARYARSLLDALELNHRLRPLAALPGVRPVDITKQRLEHVMLHSSKFHKRAPRWLWLVLIAGFILFAPVSGLTPRVAGAGPKGSPGSSLASESAAPQVAAAPGEPAATSGAKSKPELVLQTGHGAEITRAVFSADGRYILSGADDGRAILWDAETGRLLRTFGKPSEGAVGFRRAVAALSPDGKFVLVNAVVGSSNIPGQPVPVLNSALILSDAATGDKVRTFQVEPSGDIQAVAFSPNGTMALTGDGEGSAVLYDTNTGEEIRTFQGHAPINAVAFSPNGKFIATTGWGDNAAILWSLETGERLRMFKADPVQVASPGASIDIGLGSSLAFSSNSEELLAGLHDKMAISWNVHTGDRLRTFQGHKFDVNSVAFSPDGKQVLTGANDNTAALWDPATRRRIRIFRANSPVMSVAFRPDGKRILTGADGRLNDSLECRIGRKTPHV